MTSNENLFPTGLLIGGSAGCGILQSNKERIVVAKAFIEASNGRLAIIVHTGFYFFWSDIRNPFNLMLQLY